MQRIPFALESYQLPSLPLSAKRLMNYYAEAQPNDARTVASLMPAAGLTVDQMYGVGPILAMNADQPGRVYVASGTEFYRQAAGAPPLAVLTTEDLGPIGTPATDVLPTQALIVTIAVGPTACVVCVPPNAFTCTHNGPLNKITGTFPGAASVAYIDGYFVFGSYENSSQFFISALLDPTNFAALDFAFADGLTNVIRLVLKHRGELWLLGESGIEVQYDTGVAGTGAALDFPFRRQTGGVIPYPVATPKSVAIADNSVFWVGRDGLVYRANGYTAVRVSTHAIENILQTNDPGTVVSGMSYSFDGHIFYSVTSGGQTLVYDCATKAWHNRSSSADGSGRWRGNVSVIRGDQYLVGDYTSGKVYFIDRTVGTENGVEMLHQTILPPLWAGTNRAFMNRLEVEMEVGAGAGVLVEWSDDGGWNFTGSRTLTSGGIGERGVRVYTTRLGSFRQRVFRITASKRAVLYAVDADITAPGAGG